MLEVVFSDSVKASMRMAKNYDEKQMAQEVIGFVSSDGALTPEQEEEARRRWLEQCKGEAIGGNRDDVVYTGFMLDMGDINGDIDGKNRRDVFTRMWGRYSMSSEEEEQFFSDQHKDYDKLMAATKSGKGIRIWKSNAPYALCAFHYVCYLLREIDCPLHVISLPSIQQRGENEAAFYHDWGEIFASQFYSFLPLEKSVSTLEKRIYADRWYELMQENGQLRASVSGRLVTVAEDFYDPFILQYIPQGNFHMARLIGELLGRLGLGIGDYWYAYRIEEMIRKGMLAVIEEPPSDHPYSKTLRRI